MENKKSEKDEDVVFVHYVKKRTLPESIIRSKDVSLTALSNSTTSSHSTNAKANSEMYKKFKSSQGSSPFTKNLKSYEYTPGNALKTEASTSSKSSLNRKGSKIELSFEELCTELRKSLSPEQVTVFDKVVRVIISR